MTNTYTKKLVNRDVYQMRLETASFSPFNNECFVCNRKARSGKGFTFHHLYYRPGDRKYSDFANMLEYTRYVVGCVNNNPKQFLFVCNKHHQSIEKLKRFNNENFERLVRAVRMSKEMEVKI